MKKSIRFLLVAAIITGQLGISTEMTHACSCVMREDTEEAVRENLERLDAVFRGTVLSVDDSSFTATGKIEFEVSEVWKGSTQKNLTVRGAGSSAGCGWTPEVGKEYIVFATLVDGEYGTSICEYNHEPPLTPVEEAVFGLGAPAVDETDKAGWWSGVVQKVQNVFASLLSVFRRENSS